MVKSPSHTELNKTLPKVPDKEKPWNNHLFQVTCETCGGKGWNLKAAEAWFGVTFRHANPNVCEELRIR